MTNNRIIKKMSHYHRLNSSFSARLVSHKSHAIKEGVKEELRLVSHQSVRVLDTQCTETAESALSAVFSQVSFSTQRHSTFNSLFSLYKTLKGISQRLTELFNTNQFSHRELRKSVRQFSAYDEAISRRLNHSHHHDERNLYHGSWGILNSK